MGWNGVFRLGIVAGTSLGAAWMFGQHAAEESRNAAAIAAHGRDATAAITRIYLNHYKDRAYYTIELAWRDKSGMERQFGPIGISDAYAQRIVANGKLTTQKATIRYLEEDRSAHPIIVADPANQTERDYGRSAAVGFGLFGVVMALVTFRRAARAADAA